MSHKTFVVDFYEKIKKWYLYHLEYHLPNKKRKKGRDYYHDLETYLDAKTLTAQDEIDNYSKWSHFRYDHDVMNNAANVQMEVRRCVYERDLPIDEYWARWNSWLEYEYKFLTDFKEIVVKTDASIQAISRPTRKIICDGGIEDAYKGYDYMEIFKVKETSNLNTGTPV